MRIVLARILALAAALSAFGTAHQADAKNRYVPKRPGEVIFLRGLANLFSLGLDTLAAELKKYGVYSQVYNHSEWEAVGAQLVAKHERGQLSYPLVIIGHSLGAGASPKLATMLGRRDIAVQYMVMLDAVEPLRVTNLVVDAVNFYLPKKRGQNLATSSADFLGQYVNVNVKEQLGGIDHFNIDENETLRGQMTRRIFDLIAEQEAGG